MVVGYTNLGNVFSDFYFVIVVVGYTNLGNVFSDFYFVIVVVGLLCF